MNIRGRATALILTSAMLSVQATKISDYKRRKLRSQNFFDHAALTVKKLNMYPQYVLSCTYCNLHIIKRLEL